MDLPAKTQMAPLQKLHSDLPSGTVKCKLQLLPASPAFLLGQVGQGMSYSTATWGILSREVIGICFKYCLTPCIRDWLSQDKFIAYTALRFAQIAPGIMFHVTVESCLYLSFIAKSFLMFLDNLYKIWLVFVFVFLFPLKARKRKVILKRPNIYHIVNSNAVGINNDVAIET